jgi:hypothetical protein
LSDRMEVQHVAHPKFGKGITRQTRLGGFESLVAFEDGFQSWVRSDQLTKSAATTIPARVPSATPSAPIVSVDQVYSTPRAPIDAPDQMRETPQPDAAFMPRRMIEAFRLGIVPHDQVDQFTFGRDQELREIEKWLQDDRSGGLLMLGQYGSGKSHLLSCLTHRALRDGYAVAEVEVDGTETSFSKPKAVYRHLMRSFRFIPKGLTSELGFREFVTATLKQGVLKDHPFFGGLRPAAESAVWDGQWEWIMGEPSQGYYTHRQLYDHTTTANIYCNLLSGLGWASVKAMGLKGLILVFDEAESMDYIWSSYYYGRADNFIHALLQTAGNDKLLRGECWKTSLVHSGWASDVPFLYRDTSNLKLVFAFTPGSYANGLRAREPRIRHLEVPPLTQDSLRDALTEVCALYRKAYPGSKVSIQFHQVAAYLVSGTDSVRRFVKASVEALDIARFSQSGVSRLESE